MNLKAIATAVKIGKKVIDLASSEEERSKALIGIEQIILLVIAGSVFMSLFFGIIFITAMIGGVSSDKTVGFRSGTPTTFANTDMGQYKSIFLKAQSDYDVSWAVLAAIAKIESSFGQNMGPSSAGAIGFMQFMPDTWEKYKQDGNNDGNTDPYDPWDAVFSTANMLKQNGFKDSPEDAIFRYNHSNGYVTQIMELAYSYSSTMLPTGNGIWPLPSNYVAISSEYGNRPHPVYGDKRFHDGIDLPAPEGTPVFAVQDGRVTWDWYRAGYGLCVELNHGASETIYAHLSAIATKIGTQVQEGDVIGYVGSTGLSTGPHLHFGVYVNNNPCNPEQWLAVPSNNY